jgi:YVTN family beta-propeller protein
MNRSTKFPKFLNIVLAILIAGIAAITPGLQTKVCAATGPTVISNIKMGDGGHGPIEVAVNPNTNRIYVLNNSSENISVIDGVTNAVVAMIDNCSGSLAVNPNTNRIYVFKNSSNNILVIDGMTNTVVAMIDNCSGYLSVNPVTNRIYMTGVGSDGNGYVSVIDGVSNKVIATVSVGMNPLGIGINPITNRVYVANLQSGTVSVIDGTTNVLVATVNVGVTTNGWGPGYIAVNPSTNRIYVTNCMFRSKTAGCPEQNGRPTGAK